MSDIPTKKVFGFVNPELKFDSYHEIIPEHLPEDGHLVNLDIFWQNGTPIKYLFRPDRLFSTRPRNLVTVTTAEIRLQRRVGGLTFYPDYLYQDYKNSRPITNEENTVPLRLSTLFPNDGYFLAHDEAGREITRKLMLAVGAVAVVEKMILPTSSELKIAA